MKLQCKAYGKFWSYDTSEGVSLSIPMDEDSARAWYLNPLSISPVRQGDFIGSVEAGAPVNFYSISFNPHAHGTHTENVGHISKERITLQSLPQSIQGIGRIISLEPKKHSQGEDQTFMLDQFEDYFKNIEIFPSILIVRSLPNTADKLTTDYSHTNPPYFQPSIAHWMRSNGIDHLVVDLPSVDKEEDEGLLLFHHAFWDYPQRIDPSRTISELAYVPTQVTDGLYYVQIGFPPFVNDASPSQIVVFPLKEHCTT